MTARPSTDPAARLRQSRVRLALLILPLAIAGFWLAGGFTFLENRLSPSYQGRTLLSWMRQLSPEVVTESDAARQEAADALRHIGPDAVPTLLAWLSARDSRMDGWLWLILDKIRWIKWRPMAAQTKAQYAVMGFAALGGQGSSATPRLRQLAEDSGCQVNAFQALAAIGEPAVPALAELIRSPHPQTRRLAIMAGAAVGKQASVLLPLYLPELATSSTARRAFGEFGTNAARYAPRIAPFLAGSSEEAFDAAYSLGRMGDAGAIELTKALGSTNFSQRRAACTGMAWRDLWKHITASADYSGPVATLNERHSFYNTFTLRISMQLYVRDEAKEVLSFLEPGLRSTNQALSEASRAARTAVLAHPHTAPTRPKSNPVDPSR